MKMMYFQEMIRYEKSISNRNRGTITKGSESKGVEFREYKDEVMKD